MLEAAGGEDGDPDIAEADLAGSTDWFVTCLQDDLQLQVSTTKSITLAST